MSSATLALDQAFVPISLAAYVGIAPEKNNAVAGLVNFMRNMGSSVGTSMVTTLIALRSQYHQEILGDYVREGSSALQNTADGLISAADALKQADARIYQLVQAQAATLAYVDTFMVLAIGSAIMFCLAFVLKNNSPGSGRDMPIE